MKYLDIKLTGHDFIRAFENEKKEKPQQPDYKGDGVAVWVRKSKEKPEVKEGNQIKVEA